MARRGADRRVLLLITGTPATPSAPVRSQRAHVVSLGHMVAAFLSFLGAGSGLIVVSRRMANDPRWRSVAAYALATSIAIVVLFVVNGLLVRPDDAPLHAGAGSCSG